MAQNVHYLKVDDLAPDLLITVKDAAGDVVILTGATIVFSMYHKRTGTAKVAAQAAAIVGDGSAGQVKYEWSGTDTDTDGEYAGEFDVTPASGDGFRVPTRGFITIIIQPNAD